MSLSILCYRPTSDFMRDFKLYSKVSSNVSEDVIVGIHAPVYEIMLARVYGAVNDMLHRIMEKESHE